MRFKLLWVGILVSVVLTTMGQSGCSVPSTTSTVPNTTDTEEKVLYGSEKSWLGTNLAGVADFGADWPFVDIFKTSRPWISGTFEGAWDDGRELDLDENGWVKSLLPDQVARTTLYFGAPEYFPTGNYLVLFDGEGSLDFQYCGVVDVQPGRAVIDVQSGFVINITSTNPDDYLRNLRVIMPGYWDSYEENTFYPPWLDNLKKYGTLRFMDWQRTNETMQDTWDDRVGPNYCRYSSVNGAPLEVMIQLCNEARCDAWFCIPHLADDDYIRNFATIVRDQLDPNLVAYFEYSNETWNWLFPSNIYCRENGIAMGWDQDMNEYYAGWRWYSHRSVEMFDDIESVFGSEAMGIRAVRVLGVQPWRDQLRTILDWEDAKLKTDAVAAAAYFGGDIRGDYATDVDTLIDRLENYSLAQTNEWMGSLRAICDERGVPRFLAYEGGQHLAFGSATPEQDTLMNEANRDPRMRELYNQLFEDWRNVVGGGVFCNYNNTGEFGHYGRWGVLEYTGQPTSEAPKYQAVLDVLNGLIP